MISITNCLLQNDANGIPSNYSFSYSFVSGPSTHTSVILVDAASLSNPSDAIEALGISNQIALQQYEDWISALNQPSPIQIPSVIGVVQS